MYYNVALKPFRLITAAVENRKAMYCAYVEVGLLGVEINNRIYQVH
jgi:hypothetical protein